VKYRNHRTGLTDLTVVQYSATNSGQLSNNQIDFQGNIVKTNCIYEKVCTVSLCQFLWHLFLAKGGKAAHVRKYFYMCPLDYAK
jgi:hypothetical protein